MGASALPYGGWKTVRLTAKDDIDNVGAGRAAKGATLGKAKENASIFRRLLQPNLKRTLYGVRFTFVQAVSP